MIFFYPGLFLFSLVYCAIFVFVFDDHDIL